MDYEQKYKDVLERVKELLDSAEKQGHIIVRVEDIENTFPELKESEDELTWLTKYIEEEAYYLSIDIRDNEDRMKLKKLQRSLAWLEKQGEQKPYGQRKECSDCQFNYTGECKGSCQMKIDGQKPAKNIVEAWKYMRLEVYQQASGNRHEPNYSDDTTKMFSLNDIDEIIEKISEQKTADKVEPKFKVGQLITDDNGTWYKITNIKCLDDWYYELYDVCEDNAHLELCSIIDEKFRANRFEGEIKKMLKN